MKISSTSDKVHLKKLLKGMEVVYSELNQLGSRRNGRNIVDFRYTYCDFLNRIRETDFENHELNIVAAKFPDITPADGVWVRWFGGDRFIRNGDDDLLKFVLKPIYPLIRSKKNDMDMRYLKNLLSDFINTYYRIELSGHQD